MDLSARSYQQELLDRDDIPFADIKRNMHELDLINTHLGGHAITIEGLKQLLQRFSLAKGGEIVICEIGCGGGDNLRAINKWCKKNNVKARYMGVDINENCILIANNACADMSATFIQSDYKAVQFEVVPDILFSSLFCHHFPDEELIHMLQWMKRNSTRGFFINDLHRHYLAYQSIKWLTRMFSKSYLVKNDAPLSVARGFLKSEWRSLFKAAGINNFSISWKWAFRWLIVSANNPDLPSLLSQNQQQPH
jgi:ubiquinone/menaquinone biosynthesis C-methylase UbiE